MLHVFTLHLVCGCYVVYGCDEYCDVCMNVLDLDVDMDVLYIVCANCAGFVILAVLVIQFFVKKFKAHASL
jgi:hypothetical protein